MKIKTTNSVIDTNALTERQAIENELAQLDTIIPRWMEANLTMFDIYPTQLTKLTETIVQKEILRNRIAQL